MNENCQVPRELSSQQNKYLRGLAHKLKPLVFIGKYGLTEEVLASVNAALAKHELIKVKFVEHKDRDAKREIVESICQHTRCYKAGTIGHMAIFYRRARKVSQRKIKLP